jgi:DNA repair exonuclease SbcCD ATPase subunit
MEETSHTDIEQSSEIDSKKNATRLIILGILVALIAIAAAVLGYHYFYTKPLLEENEELKELAELEKQEMESQYRDFDVQYEMLQSQLSNDSLIAQIENERRHTQQLLEELERTKATDAAEIKRLKAEIASLREVLKSYIVQVDSLNRLNQSLSEENTQIKAQVAEQSTQISTLSTERNQLKDKVNIAAQLDATGFWVTPKNKKSKDTQKVKDVKKLAFGFTIVKNVTAQNGQRIIYARILKPDNSVMGQKGTFAYENTQLEYTEKKYIDYTGEEEKVTMYSDVTEFLEAGTYKLFVFCDKQMIGQTTFTLK